MIRIAGIHVILFILCMNKELISLLTAYLRLFLVTTFQTVARLQTCHEPHRLEPTDGVRSVFRTPTSIFWLWPSTRNRAGGVPRRATSPILKETELFIRETSLTHSLICQFPASLPIQRLQKSLSLLSREEDGQPLPREQVQRTSYISEVGPRAGRVRGQWGNSGSLWPL